MSVVSGVGGTTKFLRDSISKQERKYLVVDAEGAILIEGQEDQSVGSIKARILQQWLEKVLEPLASEIDVGVMCIIEHIRSDPDPLGKRIVSDVDCEVVKIPDESSTMWDSAHRVVNDVRIVLALIECQWSRREVQIIDGIEAVIGR